MDAGILPPPPPDTSQEEERYEQLLREQDARYREMQLLEEAGIAESEALSEAVTDARQRLNEQRAINDQMRDLLARAEDEESETEPTAVTFEVVLRSSEPPMRVEVGRRAVENLGALVARAGLAMLDPGVAAGTLLVAAGGLPTISRPRFESGVVSLLPVEVLDSLSEEERSALGAALGAIYDAFDRSGADAADVTALAAGFTLLCAGRKSAKLLAAWEIVAEDATRGGWVYSGSDGASCCPDTSWPLVLFACTSPVSAHDHGR